MGRILASFLSCVVVVAAWGGVAVAQPDASAVASEEPAQAPVEAVPAPALDPEMSVGSLLRSLGEPPPDHWIEPTPELVAQGRALVVEGRAVDPFGRPGAIQSPAFVCTDCHNLDREDPDLLVSDPEARLTYAAESDLPFLPGTSLWGVVNREAWFNDDYIKKYGSLVKPANGSLRWALQLCSAECSQGRMLEGWEMDAVLAFLWTLQITVGDLALDEEATAAVQAGLADPAARPAAVLAVKSAFLPGSPAHTGNAPADREAGYGNTGDPARGKLIYERTCLTCHEAGGPGTYRFGSSRASYAELLGNRTQDNNWSLYTAVRYGTRPYGVPMAYMPFFTQERMSDQQLDDLVAFLKTEVEK